MRWAMVAGMVAMTMGCGRADVGRSARPAAETRSPNYVMDGGALCLCDAPAVHAACEALCPGICAKDCGYDGVNHSLGCAPGTGSAAQCCVEGCACDCD